MNDLPPDSQGTSEDTAEQWGDLATLPLDSVRELIVVLGKALRAFQLYDENNPVYQRFVSNLRESFDELWSEVPEITLAVTEDSLLMGPAEVYRAESRSDSLAFLFYKDGIRELTLLPGIEQEELTRFLSVLQKARQLRSEGDDLLTILWEEDLAFLKYQYTDLLAEGIELPEPGEGHSQAELKAVLEEEIEEASEAEGDEQQGEPEAQKPVSQEDFNPTLYSLDGREVERLHEAIQGEIKRDLRTDVLNALFDRLEEAENPERQSEILGIFHQLLPTFLSRRAVGGASRILRELSALERTEGALDETRRSEASAILDEISAPHVVDEVVQALEDGSIRHEVTELGALLTFLRAAALEPLIRAAETTAVRELRPLLLEAVQGIAKKNPEALADLLHGEDGVVVAGAARLTGRMKLTDAGPTLAELMDHVEPEVRLAAVEAATELRASTAAGALERVLDDPDREVRIAAARALGALRYAPAAARLGAAVKGKELKTADITEKIAFFEAYGLLGGEEAVDVLDGLLNGKGFLGRREPDEIRACAALALGKIGSPEAREALEDARGEEEPVVRSAVNRALRGED